MRDKFGAKDEIFIELNGIRVNAVPVNAVPVNTPPVKVPIILHPDPHNQTTPQSPKD